MSLSSEDRNSIVLYRIERAYSTLDEAEMVANQGRYNLAANRLYYAVYYAASALLISNERPVKTHSGMISQMNLLYVKKGILTFDDGALISQLFSLRQSSDYEDFKEVTHENIEELTPRVKELVKKLKSLVEK